MVSPRVRIAGIVIIAMNVVSVIGYRLLVSAMQVQSAPVAANPVPAGSSSPPPEAAAAIAAAQAASQAASSPPAWVSVYAFALPALCIAMGLYLIIRGSHRAIAWFLLVSVVLGVLGFVTRVFALLGSISSLAPQTLVMFGISAAALYATYWCYSVVSEDLEGGGFRRDTESTQEDDRVGSGTRPSFLQAASDQSPSIAATPPAAVVALPVVQSVPVQPAVLLHLAQPMSAEGFGGWIQSVGGVVRIQVSPVAADTELLMSGAEGGWTALPSIDPATAACDAQIPAGAWYVLVRSPSIAASEVILYVTEAPFQQAAA